MATIDPNGVLIYQDTDNYTPIQTALNLAQSNLSSIIGANAQIVKASSVSDRNAKAAARGSISKTNPFVVWRADALDGLQLEYTTNGTTWRTISDKEYYDTQAAAAAALDVRFRKVANETARTAYVNEVGIANITTANPLAVHRSNAPEGLRFEVTYNGTTWRTIADKEYYDAQAAANDTGWQPITMLTGYVATENLSVRRIGKEVFIRGCVARSGGATFPTALTSVGTIPVGFRPGNYFRVAGTAYPSTAARGSEWSVATGGDLSIGSIGAGTDVCRLNASWLID